MEQLLAHLIGDYCLQSHWMATTKTSKSSAALIHAVLYTVPFLLITRTPVVLAVICSTHFVIDRWRLARYVVWLKNWLAPCRLDGPGSVGFPAWKLRHPDARRVWPKHGNYRLAFYTTNPPWSDCQATGYPSGTPAWLAVWLLIITDNAMHLALNYAAIRWL